jgi:hypothetical protein
LVPGLMLVILATWEAEMQRIMFPAQPAKMFARPDLNGKAGCGGYDLSSNPSQLWWGE